MAIHFSSPTEAGAAAYNGRITLFVVLSCVTAAMGGVIFGYDIGGVTSMEAFLKKFFPAVYARMRGDTRVSNYCKFDSQLLTTFTSSLYIAGLFATFAAAPATRGFGRRPTMLVGGASFFAGAALGGSATSIYMVIFGRVLLGVGLGLTNQAVPLYLSEMAPPRYRGAFNNSFQFSIGVGGLSASLVNYGTEKIPGGWGWRISLALAAVPAFLLSLGALFLPETPNSLVQQGGDPLAAKRILQQIRGVADVDAEFDDLVVAADASRAIRRPFCQILRREHRPHLVMAVAIPFFQQVTGINVIAFYVPVLIRTIGLGESAALLSAVMTAGVGSASTLVSMFVVDRVGRRALFLAGGILMLVTQVMIGGILARQLGDEGGVSRGYAYLLLVLIAVYVAGFGLSWGPLGWLVPSEIFPLEIRSAGQSITVAVNFLFTFVVAQTFLAMLCHMRSGIFFFFAGWLVAMTAFVYWMLPETRNIPMEQMGKVWREHWFWKKVIGGSQGADPKINDLS